MSSPPQSLYIHIPFCRRACHYCDFHFSTVLKYKEEVLQAMLLELDMRRRELPERRLSSIYFGGGTPSLLSISELNTFFEQIARYFSWEADAEITLEANPDDLKAGYLQALKNETPINRLSIGVQSFHAKDLQEMGRIHTAEQALQAVLLARDAGFDNLSIDLIFGSPSTTDEMWAANLAKAQTLQIPHLSCYALTVEERTALGYRVRKGISPPPPEEKATRQFKALMEFAERQGYEQYEISNFAQPGHRAVHNSSYWQGAAYLGIGPSAHSFDGRRCRRWNVANNGMYLQRINNGLPSWEEECLTSVQQYNELVLTRLRTKEGIRLAEITPLGEHFSTHFIREAAPLLESSLLQKKQNSYALTKRGKLLADFVSASLFWV